MSGKTPYKWPYAGEDVVKCKGPDCDADIYWATTKAGKPMPVTYKTGEAHFIACPNAGDFRSRFGPKQGRSTKYRR